MLFKYLHGSKSFSAFSLSAHILHNRSELTEVWLVAAFGVDDVAVDSALPEPSKAVRDACNIELKKNETYHTVLT